MTLLRGLNCNVKYTIKILKKELLAVSLPKESKHAC